MGGDKGLTATMDRLLTKQYTNNMMKGLEVTTCSNCI